jgi:membrane protein required for colicin V production
MNWLDILVLVLIAVPTFIGLSKGLIKILLILGGLIAGVILAGRYHSALAEQLTFIAQDNVASIVAFAIILVGVLIIATIIASVLKTIASAILLRWLNRLGGALFGFLIGAIFCGAALATWVKFFGMSTALEESITAPVLLDRLPLVRALLPDEFDAVRSFFR